MRVFEVMTSRVKTVAPTTPAEGAWQTMQAGKVRHLIVKAGSDVVGVLSDADLGGPHGAALRSGQLVSDLMQARFAVVAPDDTVRKAANLMSGRRADCLPVVRGTRLRGIVTATDLLALLGRGVDRPGHEERAAMHHRVPHRKTAARRTAW